MNKIFKLIVPVFTVFILTACGRSVHEELQETNWQIVQSNGVSGTVQFNEDTMVATHGQLGIEFSFGYQLNDDETEFSMTDLDDNETNVYTIEKNNEEYSFSPITEKSDDDEEDEISFQLIPMNEE